MAAGMILVAVPPERAVHWWPKFYCGLPGQHEEDRQRLEELLVRLACLLSEEVGESHWSSGMRVPGAAIEGLLNDADPHNGKEWRAALDRFGEHPWQGTDVRRIIRADHAQLIRDLYDAIADVLINTCREAMVEGQDLLRNLALGRVSPHDFDAIRERTRKKSR